MLSRRAAIAVLSLLPVGSASAQWPADSYRTNTNPEPATPRPKPPPRPRTAVPPPDSGGIIYAADSEARSLSIPRQIAGTLGGRFQAEPSRSLIACVEHLATKVPNVGWAVLPATALAFLEKNSQGQSLCYIARVGVSDLHVIAAPQIRHLSELGGRKVNLGPSGSQNQITASLLLESASLRVEPLYDDHERALTALMQGRITAMILLAAKPSDLLFAAQGMHFLTVNVTMPGCIPDQILPGDYPLLGGGEAGRGGPVDTLAVPLVLASRNWPAGSNEYLATAQVADLLSKQKRPDEMAVDVAGWQRFGPVAEWLGHAGRESILQIATGKMAAR